MGEQSRAQSPRREDREEWLRCFPMGNGKAGRQIVLKAVRHYCPKEQSSQSLSLLIIKGRESGFSLPKAAILLKGNPLTDNPQKAENGVQIVRTEGRQNVADRW
jgi:hypothetical protein